MRADLEPHPAGDLESSVATRPASSAAAAAAAAAALQQQQQRIPPARSRRGHAAHQKKHREEAVLTRRPAQHQHQPHASLQHVDWHTSLRHICTASSRWNLRSRRAVVVAQWPQLRPRTPGRGQRARRPVAGTASERDQRHRAREIYDRIGLGFFDLLLPSATLDSVTEIGLSSPAATGAPRRATQVLSCSALLSYSRLLPTRRQRSGV